MSPFNCPNKEHARNAIWKILAPLARFTNTVVLPADERFELDCAIRNGVPAYNLYAADKERAVLDKFIARLHPEELVHCRTGFVSSAVKSWMQEGRRFGVAVLDFCGNVSGLGHGTVRAELEMLGRSGAFPTGGLFSVVVQNGREDAFTTALLNEIRADIPGVSLDNLTIREKGRVHLLYAALDRGFSSTMDIAVITTGTYENSNTGVPMLWVIFQITRRMSQCLTQF